MKPLIRSHIDVEAAKAKGIDKLAAAFPDDELWKNDEYTVTVNRKQPTGWLGEDGKPILLTWLSIRKNDRSAIHDWRELQWMKNQLVGTENEGMEIYPAESRLVDSANSYHLWVFEDSKIRLPFGFTDRNVTNKSMGGAVQRPFPAEHMPPDAEENYKNMMAMVDKIQNGGNE